MENVRKRKSHCYGIQLYLRETRFIEPISSPGGAKKIYNQRAEDDPKD
jgi:hypothetical protein